MIASLVAWRGVFNRAGCYRRGDTGVKKLPARECFVGALTPDDGNLARFAPLLNRSRSRRSGLSKGASRCIVNSALCIH